MGALSDQLTALAYDLPSHGRSGDWDGTGDLHDVATDMGRALLTEPMDLIGHSFGATVAHAVGDRASRIGAQRDHD